MQRDWKNRKRHAQHTPGLDFALDPWSLRFGDERDPGLAGAASSSQLLFGVLAELLGTREEFVEVVLPTVEIAVVGGVIAADARAGFVDTAAVVALEMLAAREDADVPLPLLDED